MTHREIEAALGSIGAGYAPGDGLCFGSAMERLTGVTVAFTATLDAIAAAKKNGDSLLIIHERMFFPTSYSGADLGQYLSDKINLPRLNALCDAGLSVVLLADGLEQNFQRVAAETALGLAHQTQPTDVYEIAPTPLTAYVQKAMRAFGTDRARLTREGEPMITRLAILNGGEGITRSPDCLTGYLDRGAQLLIAGETDEYPKWAILDCGMALLEVGHTVFDNLGLRLLTRRLGEALPPVPVHFFEVSKPWRACRAGEAETA